MRLSRCQKQAAAGCFSLSSILSTLLLQAAGADAGPWSCLPVISWPPPPSPPRCCFLAVPKSFKGAKARRPPGSWREKEDMVTLLRSDCSPAMILLLQIVGRVGPSPIFEVSGSKLLPIRPPAKVILLSVRVRQHYWPAVYSMESIE